LSWRDPIQNLAELGQILSSRSRSRFDSVGPEKIWKYSAKSVKFFGVIPMDTNFDPHPLFGSEMDVD